MRLDTIDLRHLWLRYCSWEQSHVGKQRQQHRRCGGGGQAFGPWKLRGMHLEVQTAWALAAAGDPEAPPGAQGPGRQPCGLRPPPRAERRGRLAPAQARCDGGGVLWLGLEHLRIRTGGRAERRRQPGPALVLLRGGPPLRFHPETIARLQRGRRRRRGARAPRERARGAAAARAAPARAPPTRL
jgi:hypothetical protein